MGKQNCQHIRFYGEYDGGNIMGLANTERAISYFKNKLTWSYEEYFEEAMSLKKSGKIKMDDIEFLYKLFSFDGDLFEILKIKSCYVEFDYCPLCGEKLEKGLLEKIVKEHITEYRKTFKEIPICEMDISQPKKYNHLGYIYVIEVEGHYKIGVSKNPKSRFGEYTKLYKEPSVIICEKVKGYDIMEKKLHERYSNKNERGEWFLLDEKDIEEIRNYIKENGLRN